MSAKWFHTRLLGMLFILLATLVTACDRTPAGLGGATPTVSAAQHIVNCATTLPEMQGAQVVDIPNTDFPNSGSALVAITSPTNTPLQIVQYTACIQVFVKGSFDHISASISPEMQRVVGDTLLGRVNSHIPPSHSRSAKRIWHSLDTTANR